MNRLLPLCAAALVACSSDSVAVDPDAIDGAEKAAVQAALNVALKDDPLYPTLAFLVFPFIDRASHVSTVNGEPRHPQRGLPVHGASHPRSRAARRVCGRELRGRDPGAQAPDYGNGALEPTPWGAGSGT